MVATDSAPLRAMAHGKTPGVGLLVVWLLAGCGGFAVYGEDGVDAGVDMRPDAHDARPDAPDGKLDTRPPDTRPPDVKPPDRGPDLLPGTWIPLQAGSFQMGSPGTEDCREHSATASDKETLHPVKLTHALEIMDAEVTQAQFSSIMQYNNSMHPSSPAYPVHHVTWHEAAAYCNELTKKANLRRTALGQKLLSECYVDQGKNKLLSTADCLATIGTPTAVSVPVKSGTYRCFDLLSSQVAVYSCTGFRLPTEAEWEYAYRAKTQTPMYPVSGSNGKVASCTGKDQNADKTGWYKGNASTNARLGKGKPPNAWGLHDMAGNLAEWCHDGRAKDLGSALAQDPVTKAEVITKAELVRRGGSLQWGAWRMRAASRTFFHHAAKGQDVGFRCVRTTN